MERNLTDKRNSVKKFKKEVEASIEFSERFVKYTFHNHALKTEETKQIRYEHISNDYSSKLEPASLSLQVIHIIMFLVNMAIFINDGKRPYLLGVSVILLHEVTIFPLFIGAFQDGSVAISPRRVIVLVFFVMVGFTVVPPIMKRVRVRTINTDSGEIKIVERDDKLYRNLIAKGLLINK